MTVWYVQGGYGCTLHTSWQEMTFQHQRSNADKETGKLNPKNFNRSIILTFAVTTFVGGHTDAVLVCIYSEKYCALLHERAGTILQFVVAAFCWLVTESWGRHPTTCRHAHVQTDIGSCLLA